MVLVVFDTRIFEECRSLLYLLCGFCRVIFYDGITAVSALSLCVRASGATFLLGMGVLGSYDVLEWDLGGREKGEIPREENMAKERKRERKRKNERRKQK